MEKCRRVGRLFLILRALEKMRMNDNKSGCQYQAWRNTVISFQNGEEIQRIYKGLHVIREHNGTTRCFSTTTTTTTTLTTTTK